MKIVGTTGCEDIALVYIAEFASGKFIECVESVQPPLPRDQKWVLLVSTMFGCPVHCKMCDAGGYYQGKLTADEIMDQIDFMVYRRYPDGNIPARNFKIQFARMGEPSLNLAVLDVLDKLASRYNAPGLMPSLSTVAPIGSEQFFEGLIKIKRDRYPGGRFQFQFSIHTTEESLRDQIIPCKKWSFARLAEYGDRFYQIGDRKITLNFALAQGMPVDPSVLLQYFDPDRYLIKITPLNPTHHAIQNQLTSHIEPLTAQLDSDDAIVHSLRTAGYTVIVSIGELEENQIGSNCGQYVLRHLQMQNSIHNGYTYKVEELLSLSEAEETL